MHLLPLGLQLANLHRLQRLTAFILRTRQRRAYSFDPLRCIHFLDFVWAKLFSIISARSRPEVGELRWLLLEDRRVLYIFSGIIPNETGLSLSAHNI